MTSLYMINPRHHVSNPETPVGFVTVPDLAIVTVAALAPPSWDVTVCEESVTDVDFETPARFVGLTGKTAQLPRMIELAAQFRRRGKVVLIGGPLASLDPEALRPHADVLVTGEMEDIAPDLFADLARGSWKPLYEGGRADVRKSPVPRWDLYPVDRAMVGALQTTRGCPFDCEFCDVIRYYGRKQRHKDMDQILRELDALHAAGFRQVFLTDDNFTVHRQFVRATLDALTSWNARHAGDSVRFVTQASIDIARDDDILRACVEAGLDHLFIGIETVNAESLRETNKRQNLLMPAHEAVRRIVSHGILIRNGVVMGFDHDGPDIFDIQFEFLQSNPLPVPTLTTLTASKGTPLYERMQRDGRLIDADRKWNEALVSNVAPMRMSHEELLRGALDLSRRVYSPAAFEHRMINFIEIFATAIKGSAEQERPSRSATGARNAHAFSCMRRISARGDAEAKMVPRLLAAAARKPGSLRSVISCLVFYDQYRGYLDDIERRRLLAA